MLTPPKPERISISARGIPSLRLGGTEDHMRWISLLFWLVLCFAVAGVSSTFTVARDSRLVPHPGAPTHRTPNWVFGPVWTTLYAMMAIAAWRAWLAPASSLRTTGLILFLVQLALNFAWSFIFFRQHALGRHWLKSSSSGPPSAPPPLSSAALRRWPPGSWRLISPGSPSPASSTEPSGGSTNPSSTPIPPSGDRPHPKSPCLLSHWVI